MAGSHQVGPWNEGNFGLRMVSCFDRFGRHGALHNLASCPQDWVPLTDLPRLPAALEAVEPSDEESKGDGGEG